MGEVDIPDFEHIWLSPKCDEEGDGRMWCEDDRGPCDDCGMPSTKYVRADLYDALASALAQAEKERDEAKDAGVDFVLDYLGKVLHAENWTPCEGEIWEEDVQGTVCNILRTSKVLDEETDETAMSKLSAALSQLAEARGENEWRPIESAPRDGRVVDYKTASGSLSDPGGEIGRMMWVVDDDQDYAGFWDFDRDQEAHPEWWAPPRPLPSPPH